MNSEQHKKSLEIMESLICKISEENRRKEKQINRLMKSMLIGFSLYTAFFISFIAFGVYFLNTFDLNAEVVEETVTIDGEDAQYNQIKGNNNSISTTTNSGGSK